MIAESISILCVDDNPLVGESLGRWFGRLSEFRWLGWRGTTEGLADAAASLAPDIVLMDYDMPGEDCPTAICQLVGAYPSTKAVVLSGHCRDDYIHAALAAGASGYLLKDDSPAEIAAALKLIHNGQLVMCDAAKQSLSRRTQARSSVPGAVNLSEVLGGVDVLEGFPVQDLWDGREDGGRECE